MKKILILQGGYNEEHKVSLKTSKEVSKTLKKLKISYKTINVNPKKFIDQISKYKNNFVCFNALHGTFGEDGKIQKILKTKQFKVTHSNELVSSNCFDKLKSKKIVNKFKIQTPKFKLVKNIDLNDKFLFKIKKKFDKFVIKPASSGSSYGLNIIKSNKGLNIFLKKLVNYKKKFKNEEKFLIEEFISGKELTVSVIKDNISYKPIEVTEIVSLNQSYDYQAKYTKGFSKHYLPARITKKQYKKCLSTALKVHKIFKCNTLSRVDFIINKKQNKIYFLEINSQPGMTKLSLLPEQASFHKISFESIILNLIKNAK